MKMTIKYLSDIWLEEKYAPMNQFHHYKKQLRHYNTLLRTLHRNDLW